MLDLSVELPVELELPPVELPAPELVLELVPLFIPEDEDVELCLSDDVAPELLPEPVALELPEPETAPDELEPSLVREVDAGWSPGLEDIDPEPLPDALPEPDTAPEADVPSVERELDEVARSREPDSEPELLLEPETDESTEPVEAPPRTVVSPRARSSLMTVSLRAERPSRSSWWTEQPVTATIPARDTILR